jgi:hypothetical protein
MEKSESRIQQECVEWFRNKCVVERLPYIVFSVPNESNEGKIRGSIKNRMGRKKGAADLVIDTGNEVFYIEMKDHKGTQEPDQKKFEVAVKKIGRTYVLFRSLEEFQEWTSSYVFNQNL